MHAVSIQLEALDVLPHVADTTIKSFKGIVIFDIEHGVDIAVYEKCVCEESHRES
ncbi:MAG TPA: hypothetical protein VFI43_00890 [Nitrosospira sp.]|nr:hypothetical protein [Nitrosospira sp.]